MHWEKKIMTLIAALACSSRFASVSVGVAQHHQWVVFDSRVIQCFLTLPCIPSFFVPPKGFRTTAVVVGIAIGVLRLVGEEAGRWCRITTSAAQGQFRILVSSHRSSAEGGGKVSRDPTRRLAAARRHHGTRR